MRLILHDLPTVRTVETISAMQRLARQWQMQRVPVSFVPTMGCLHSGHLSLIQCARRIIGPRGKVVVSVYVNPTQFGPAEDYANYPHNLFQDRKLCSRAGVEVLFVPSDAEMYPAAFSTWVVEESLTRGMEGASRPTHFRGVATVVAKLFNIVLPTAAVFGAKDFQQAALIQKMTRELNFPIKIVVSPIVRERDGLAFSSRNRYLTKAQRSRATVLWRAIQQARASLGARPIPAARLKEELRALVEAESGVRLDYIEFFDPQTLAPAARVSRGTHIALAVFIGRTRLIDNAAL